MKTITLCSLILFAYFASAQTRNNVEGCIKIESDAARLLCFDELFNATDQSLKSVDTSPIQPAIASAAKANAILTNQALVDNFGGEGFNRNENKEELNRIESVIDSIFEDNRKIRTFTLANGQVWRETENSRLLLKAGTLIYVEKGLLSGHFLSKESSKRRVRVNRVK
jgi:hypothetical protein